MDNGLLSPPKGAYVCLCTCVGVQVTSCVELPVDVPQTPLDAAGAPCPIRPGPQLMSEMIARTHTFKSVEIFVSVSVFFSCHTNVVE